MLYSTINLSWRVLNSLMTIIYKHLWLQFPPTNKQRGTCHQTILLNFDIAMLVCKLDLAWENSFHPITWVKVEGLCLNWIFTGAFKQMKLWIWFGTSQVKVTFAEKEKKLFLLNMMEVISRIWLAGCWCASIKHLVLCHRQFSCYIFCVHIYLRCFTIIIANSTRLGILNYEI